MRHPLVVRRGGLAVLACACGALAACGNGGKTTGAVPTVALSSSAGAVTSSLATSTPATSNANGGLVTSEAAASPSGTTADGTTGATDAATEPPTEPATEPPTEPPTEAPTTAKPTVTVVLIGSVNGGQAGGFGEGSTDSASEMIREEDGSCQGWNGRRTDRLWTQDVTGGAALTVVDGTSGATLATGKLGAGHAVDVSPKGDESWQCTFAFDVGKVPQADSYAIKVGRLGPWPLLPDPTHAGQFAVSVATPQSSEGIDACAPSAPLPSEVSEWRAIGQYWNQGIASICSAGLRVPAGNGINRVCQPRGIASDRVVSIVDKANTKRVIEDATGVKVDLTTLKPGMEVVVNVATGIPCA